MVDLDALKRDLEAAGWLCDVVDEALTAVAHKGHIHQIELTIDPVFADGSLFVQSDGENCIPLSTVAIIARHVSPQPSPGRAALVERMAQTIRSAWIDWEIDDTAGGKTYAAVAAEAALAAVEAAGWGPPIERKEARHERR